MGAGTRISGGWELTGVDFPTNAYIRARGFVAGGKYSGSAWFTDTLIGPPLVAAQPASRTNNAGTVATFTVLGTGTPPLSYQWRKGGVDLADGGSISGAQTATLRLSSVFGADADAYSVVISNSLGSVTSQVATLEGSRSCTSTRRLTAGCSTRDRRPR